MLTKKKAGASAKATRVRKGDKGPRARSPKGQAAAKGAKTGGGERKPRRKPSRPA